MIWPPCPQPLLKIIGDAADAEPERGIRAARSGPQRKSPGRICGKPAKSAPRQLAHHVGGVKSDRLAKLYQLDHVDPALAVSGLQTPVTG
jgi:hypothetical protein